MTPEYYLRLYAYNDWANGQMLEAAGRLSNKDYMRDFGQAWGSVRGTLTHLLVADRVWLRRWQGGNPSADHDEEATPSIEALRAVWKPLMSERNQFLEQVTEAELRASRPYQTTSGTPYDQPLWEQLTHVINHGTDHRGHLSVMLTELGQAPPPLDYIYWVREHPLRG